MVFGTVGSRKPYVSDGLSLCLVFDNQSRGVSSMLCVSPSFLLFCASFQEDSFWGAFFEGTSLFVLFMLIFVISFCDFAMFII